MMNIYRILYTTFGKYTYIFQVYMEDSKIWLGTSPIKL